MGVLNPGPRLTGDSSLHECFGCPFIARAAAFLFSVEVGKFVVMYDHLQVVVSRTRFISRPKFGNDISTTRYVSNILYVPSIFSVSVLPFSTGVFVLSRSVLKLDTLTTRSTILSQRIWKA